MAEVKITINYGRKQRKFPFWEFVFVFCGMIALMWGIVSIYVTFQFS
jgi:hypothetical protein